MSNPIHRTQLSLAHRRKGFHVIRRLSCFVSLYPSERARYSHDFPSPAHQPCLSPSPRVPRTPHHDCTVRTDTSSLALPYLSRLFTLPYLSRNLTLPYLPGPTANTPPRQSPCQAQNRIEQRCGISSWNGRMQVPTTRNLGDDRGGGGPSVASEDGKRGGSYRVFI